jgi:alkylated DNA repair dioxygenase AlkB
MSQLTLFSETAQGGGFPHDLLDYRPQLFDEEEGRFLLQKFIAGMPWEQRKVMMYGKEVVTPRLTAWFGNPATDYSVRGEGSYPLPWTDELMMIRQRIEPLAGVSFDTVLLNYYRDGNDSVAWHTDNDGIPGRNRIVASISFGQPRVFDFRRMNDHAVKYSLLLEDGSYLLMKGEFQDKWQHRIAKSTKPLKPRVNLTFRLLGEY